MHLKYRGVSYQASFVEDQRGEPDGVGIHRHKLVADSQPAKLNLRKPENELVYRGVRYTR